MNQDSPLPSISVESLPARGRGELANPPPLVNHVVEVRTTVEAENDVPLPTSGCVENAFWCFLRSITELSGFGHVSSCRGLSTSCAQFTVSQCVLYLYHVAYPRGDGPSAGPCTMVHVKPESRNLFECIEQEEVEILRSYVERGGPVHVEDAHGDTAMTVAANTGNLELVKVCASGQPLVHHPVVLIPVLPS